MKTAFANLPLEVQAKVKSTLRAYNETRVIFSNGQYSESPGTCIRASYESDFKVIGDYTKEEVFTPEEQIINYVESFRCYPPQYKGKRDYDMCREMEVIGWDARVQFNAEGNLELIK